MKYRLIAGNDQGAQVKFYSKTIKGCINAFDNEYHRTGFRIILCSNDTGKILKVLKSTYR